METIHESTVRQGIQILMPYFYDCTTKEEARKRYLELCKKLHPDKGGNATEFKDMQAEYDRFDEPRYRFNTINPNQYNEQAFTGFNPFRSYTNVNPNNPNEFSYESYFKTQNEIEQLKNQLAVLKRQICVLNGYIDDYKNLNYKLNETYQDQISYIVKLKEHWLIGRLIKWFRMSGSVDS